MSYRISPIEVSTDKPFEYDSLDRQPMVQFISSIVTKTEGHPLVLAIDSPYGTGKSTFIGMLDAVLVQQNFQTVYFDAWKADHVSDPLIAMVAALDKTFPRTAVSAETMDRVRKITGVVVKKGLAVGARLLTAGMLEIPDDIEEALADSAADATADIIESFEKEQVAIESFRTELGKVVAKLPDLNKEPTLIFFIDELDRCRPDFAMSLLERVKHMFDVPNLVFVLSVDKKQLEAVTAAVYGERIDAAEYLRKFIDLEFALPSPATSDFVKSAIKRAGLDAEFDRRQFSEKDLIVRFLVFLGGMYNMSLRSIERAVVRLKLVMSAIPKGHDLDPVHVALLIVLRSIDKDMFDRIVKRRITPKDAIDYFQSLPNTGNRLDSSDGYILEAILVSELLSREEISLYRQEQIAILNTAGQANSKKEAATQRVRLVDSYSQGMFGGRRLARIAATIDLAANIRD